jgi:hypothetical protein
MTTPRVLFSVKHVSSASTVVLELPAIMPSNSANSLVHSSEDGNVGCRIGMRPVSCSVLRLNGEWKSSSWSSGLECSVDIAMLERVDIVVRDGALDTAARDCVLLDDGSAALTFAFKMSISLRMYLIRLASW